MLHRKTGSLGFTLTDVLVSLAVMALLVGLLMPAMSSVREVARRVVCASNIRQVGIGLILYADSNRDRLPPSVMAGTVDPDRFSSPHSSYVLSTNPGNTIALRFNVGTSNEPWWDSLGVLYKSGILEMPELFYCPSHDGPHQFENYLDAWRSDEGLVVGNYQYRGASSEGVTRFSLVQPSKTALVSDSFRSMDELNHQDGMNLLRADLSIRWLANSGDILQSSVPNQLAAMSESSLQEDPSQSSVSDSFYDTYWEHLEVWDDTGRLNKVPGGQNGNSPGGNRKP